MVIAYETESFRRRFVLEGDRLVSARSFRKNREKGEVYLGQVREKIKDLGFIVDLGGFKGLCQEELVLGEKKLFEIEKSSPDKYPLITSRVGFIGRSLILREGDNSYSKKLPETYLKLLKELELKGVYFREEARNTPLRQIAEEYDRLVSLRDFPRDSLGLVHRPYFKEEGDPFYFRELEARIVSLAKGSYKKDGVSLYFEMTRAGLVIDVNGLGQADHINKKAQGMIEEALILMNAGGLIMVDFVADGRGYSGPGSLTKEGVLVRSLPQRGTSLFSLDSELLERDYLALDKRLNEEYL